MSAADADWNRALLEEVFRNNAGRSDVGMVGTTRAQDAQIGAFARGRWHAETSALSYSFVVKQVLEGQRPFAVMNMYSAADCDADEAGIERRVAGGFAEGSYE